MVRQFGYLNYEPNAAPQEYRENRAFRERDAIDIDVNSDGVRRFEQPFYWMKCRSYSWEAVRVLIS
jgi:hypothetical protein